MPRVRVVRGRARGTGAGPRAALAGTLALAAACAHGPVDGPSARPSLEAAIAAPDARIAWVGAHPDDETSVGAILARACRHHGRPCLIVALTDGGGGACDRAEPCFPDVASVRRAELAEAARRLHADHVVGPYPNAPLPWSSFPRRDHQAARWRAAGGDPVVFVERTLAAFAPTVVLTFGPTYGFTGHPEHQLAARITRAAVARLRARPAVWTVLNRHPLARLFGRGDPEVELERFDATSPCGSPARSCLDAALAVTRTHATQSRDMGLVRALRPQLGTIYLGALEGDEAWDEAP